MYLVLIILLLIILWICAIWKRSNSLIEPFTRQFFNQIQPNHYLGIDQSQLFGNEYDFINLITHLIPFNINTVMVDRSLNRYLMLNQNEIQFMMSRSLEIYQIRHHPSLLIPMDQIRFVCALYDIPVNLLSTNTNIGEFHELKESNLTVNVGPKDSIDYLIAMDLLVQYRITVGVDIQLSYYATHELLPHYGKDVQVVILLRTHPDQTITALVNQQQTRLIEIKKYNNGDIFQITLDEKPFYQMYPYYYKNIIEKERLKKYYTNLVFNDDTFDLPKPNQPMNSFRSNYIHTIGTKYQLLSNQSTPSTSVYQLLYNMKLNMNLLNQKEYIENKLNTTSLVDFVLPEIGQIKTHEGASQFYYGTGLYTQLSDPACIMINGRCDEKQLAEHHLLRDHGPTFDQIYNSTGGGT